MSFSLPSSADVEFERYKSDTRALIYSDGTVEWYTPVIYTATCNMQVRFFPFDIQACDMVLGSWSYDGLAIDLHPEISEDAAQNR